MPFLSQLNIVKSIRPHHQPIAQLRRNKLISKLHIQLLNIQSKIKDLNLSPYQALSQVRLT
jgi:hypothetical protein